MVATVQKIPLKGLIVDIVLSILGACKLGAQIKDLYCVCVWTKNLNSLNLNSYEKWSQQSRKFH